MKNNKGFAPVLVLVVVLAVLAVGGVAYYAGTQKDVARLPDTNVVPTGNLIGGDKDAHGCLGSAGYSWCAVKNKCLRVWEEKCEATPATTQNADATVNWKVYTNAQFGIEFKYPPTWKVVQDSNWVEVSPAEEVGMNTYFSFGVTAHMYLGDEKPVVKTFGTRTGYVYTKDQSVYFPEANVAGGYVIKLFTSSGVNEPNTILSTFKFATSEIPKSKLTLNTLENAEYNSLTTGTSLKLVNGTHLLTPLAGESQADYYVKLDASHIAYGDLNNDGQEDSVVILESRAGGTGTFRQLAVMLNQNGNAKNVANQSLGDRTVVNSLNISPGTISINMTPWDGGTGVPKTVNYKLSGNKLLTI